MAGTYFSGFLLFVFVLVEVSCGQVDQKKADQYELVWADEFDYVGLPDSLKWSYDTEGNDWGWKPGRTVLYQASVG